MSIATYMFRRGCLRSDNRRDRGLTVPENVEYHYDIPYGPDKKWHTLDICYPKDVPAKATIINVHGGGYVYGSTKTYRFYCCDLAARGYTVVSFNYRLAPKHIFPSPLEDMNLVMKWVCNHDKEHPLHPNNVLVVGDSAGAQLASQYAAIWSNPEYSQIMGITPPEFRLAALGLNCGMYDLRAFTAQKIERNSILSSYFTRRPERFGSMLNVLDYIDGRYPPAYVMSAGGDFLREECQPMAELLTSRGVECVCAIYGDQSIGHVFHVDFRTDIARQANDEELKFMSRFIVSTEE